ncbi:hypothetical protein Tco_1512512, partial [Tanacetum coccineum]
VDVRTYLLGGAIDGSKVNGIIRDPKLELESSHFTFDLVPLSYESVDVVVIENWLLRHKAEMVCNEKERIKMTKRSKNSQKLTRNERDKNKSEESAKDQSRISPTQQERQSKEEIIKSRAKSDKFSKFKRLFEVLKTQGPKWTKEESYY